MNTTVKKAPKKTNKYNVVVGVNGVEHKVKTDDLENCFVNMDVGNIKTRAIITVEKNGNSVEKVLYGPRAKRLFANRNAGVGLAKHLTLILDAK